LVEVPRVFGTGSNGLRLGESSPWQRVAGRRRQPEAGQGGGVEGGRRALGRGADGGDWGVVQRRLGATGLEKKGSSPEP
jgi:hypothetical protein